MAADIARPNSRIESSQRVLLDAVRHRAEIDAIVTDLAHSSNAMPRSRGKREVSALTALRELNRQADHSVAERSKAVADPQSRCAVRRSPERLLSTIAYWIPYRHREALLGDLIEDCDALRSDGKGDSRIATHILWQISCVAFGQWKTEAAVALGWLIAKASSWI
jgi:hypothetical protein